MHSISHQFTCISDSVTKLILVITILLWVLNKSVDSGNDLDHRGIVDLVQFLYGWHGSFNHLDYRVYDAMRCEHYVLD